MSSSLRLLRDFCGLVFPALQVDYHVTLRLGATDQQIALGGRLERFGLVVYITRDQAAFASVADPRTARPAHRHVTGFREIEKSRKLCVPAHIEAAAHKRHSWTRAHRPLRRVRRCMRPIDDPGVIGLPGPKISVCTRSSETPQATSPSLKSRRNPAGPHR